MRKRKIVFILCTCFLMMILAGGCQQANEKPLLPDQNTNNVQPNQNTALTATDKRIMANRFSTTAENVEGVKNATVVVETANSVGGTTNNRVQTYNNTYTNQSPTTDNRGTIDNNQIPRNGTTNPKDTPVPGPDLKPGNGNTVSRTNNIVAMVGITMSDMSMQGTSKEETIKQDVRRKIINTDNRISEVLVTTDPDMVKKITDVATGIINGRPTSSYARDINELENMLK